MTVDFSAYLDAICNNPKYTQWWKTYTVTDVVSKEIFKHRSDDKMRSPDEVRSELPAFSPLLDLDVKVQTVPKKDEGENRKEEQEKIEKLGVLEGLRKYSANHVLLRGKPGSGKSTALIRLLLEESEKQKLGKIPVLVELRSYKTSVLDLIQNFISQNLLNVNGNDLETLLREGKLLLLVDGVNELPSNAAYRDLQQFEQQYSQIPMIFTTRELGLRGDLNIEKKLTMEPLTEPQMQQFVKGYLPEKEAEGRLKQLGGRIKELGETPLLLCMLCYVFVENQQEIPDTLGGLFRDFTKIYDDALIDKVKPYVKTKADSRLLWSDSLKHLAFEMTKRKDEPAISATEAETILGEFLAEARETDYSLRRCRLWLQDLLNYHLLQRRGQDDIEFRHQLIQEYYAAETLVLEFDKLTDEQLQWDYLNCLKWTEPMAVVAGLFKEEKQVVRLVKLGLAVDLKLGARLAGEVNYTFQGETVDLVKKLEIPALYRIELLERTKSEEAVSELEKSLNDSDDNVRRKAAEALGNIGSDKAIESLEIALNDSDDDVRRKAAEALGKIGSEKAIKSLVAVLNEPFVWIWVRRSAVEALGNIGSDQAIESLEKALNDPDKWIRRNAVEALGNIGSDQAIDSLATALDNSDENTRRKAAEALGNIGSEKAIKSLVKAVNDSGWRVREVATEVLVNIASEKAIESLEIALNDSDGRVRFYVAAVLGKIGSEKAIESLEKALNDSSGWVRERAANVLGSIGSEKAIESLEIALNDSDKYVRRSAANALGNIGSEKAIESLEIALNDSDDDVRERAAEALGKIGSEKAIESLVAVLNDSDSWVRRKAANALGNIGSEKVINSLQLALNDSVMGVRESAAKALGKIGSKKAIKSLEKPLNHAAMTVRNNPAEALRKITSKEDIERFKSALNHSDWIVRNNAAKELENIGSENTIESLSTFLLRDDQQHHNKSFSNILKALETIQNKCKIYQTLCFPFLKIPQNSHISDTKLTEYCLKYRQHHDKSRQLTQAGFSLSNPQELKQAIKQLITQNIVSQSQENEYGILYHVKGELNSINGEKLVMITVWLKRKIDQKIQFISLKII